MLQQIIKTYFIGQVALEQATEASKKSFETALEKAKEYKQKALEYKNTQITVRFEHKLKESIAELRSSSKPFEQACEALAQFLSETGEMKNHLISG
jgi:hypothetical protein